MSDLATAAPPLTDEQLPAEKEKEKRTGFLAILLVLLPKIPLIARVTLLHILRLSEQAKYLDLRSALTVAIIRSFLTPSQPRSITSTQKFFGRDPGIKGNIWVAKYTAPAPPETSIRDALVGAIEALQTPPAAKTDIRRPDLVPVEAEWTGYRTGVPDDARLPADLTEEDRYHELMRECKSAVTVLYFHGGAYWLMDPATHRPTTSMLARLTGGRCYSVRYRLAPQNPFPAALLDALTSYLTLLYPPPGAFHEPVSPEHIVFAGDSAGGNLSLALLQLLLQLHRQNTPLTWHGTTYPTPPPLPAAVAVNSPWLDLTHSSPSYRTNAAFDFLPGAHLADPPASLPPCPAWPATPPRRTLYAADALLPHPLASPLAAASWRGAPPVFLCAGWELLADEARCLAGWLHAEGVGVVFEEYEAMPHCFALVLGHLPGARRCMEAWAGFMRRAVEGVGVGESRFTMVRARGLGEVAIPVGELATCSVGEVRERLWRRCGIAGETEVMAKL